ncbi:MAG: glycosyltransferase family 4 protein, partial [Candidatus Heimdallarchaeota archaeon]|nr:glycosyltransferase family 4 protein [Candidatus Heimdallarchaeota archaeon]
IGPPYVGPMAGLRRYSYSLVQSLVNLDVDIHVVTTTKIPDDDELLDRENVHFYYLSPQISAKGAYSTQTHFYARNHRKFSKQAFEVFEELRVDIKFALIHSTEVSAYFFAKAKRKREMTIPLIISVHGAVTTGNLKSKLFVKRPYSRLLRRTIAHCDYIVTNSYSLLEKIKRLPKKTKGNIELVQTALDCKKYSQIPKIEDIETFRDKYDIDSSKVNILLQGPFITRKRQLEVIDHFPAIIKKHPNVHFLVIGEGPLLQKIKEKIVHYDIDDYVCLTGYINEKELILAYHISNIMLYPGREGSFGISIIEAMATGLSIVAVDLPPVNEMVPEDCRCLYPLEREKLLVERVTEIINNKEESIQLTFESQKHALKNYSHLVVGKKLFKFYKSIMKK